MSEKKRVRNVCLTINNPTRPIDFDARWMDYLVFQKEVGESGTPHFQGYLELKAPLSFMNLKRRLPLGAHIEERRGSQQQAIAYCKKEESRVEGPWEFGEPKQQGKRNDLHELTDLARAGKRKIEADTLMPTTYARHYKAYAHIQSLYKPARRSREVILLQGEPGTGKTRYVLDRYPNAYVIPISSKEIWFDGYDGQDVVLIDDFAGQIPLIQFLRVLHEYPEQVPIKGGHVWFNPAIIYITSNYSISEWYKWEGREVSRDALVRRITSTIIFPLSAE